MKPFTLEPESVYVVGVGAQTPVGRKALIAGAAVRCGISAYREHPFMIDRLGEPMVVAMADWLDAATEFSSTNASMLSCNMLSASSVI